MPPLRPPRRIARSVPAAALVIAAAVSVQTGCVKFASNLAHVMGADRIPAEYEGLNESTVAVVTITDAGKFADDASARLLNNYVGEILSREVDDIKLVRDATVRQWRDRHGWDQTDFHAIGQGVKAEKIVGIELTDFRLRDGVTLYRGRANVRIQVIDAESGLQLFSKTLDDYTFPKTTGQYTSETTEAKFRKLYLRMLARQIARSFHPYDGMEDFALDGSIASL